MRRTFITGAALACLTALVGVPHLGSAQTAPPWPTFHGDAQRSGVSPASGPSGTAGSLMAATSFPFLPPGVQSSPAIDANGVAYIGNDDGNVYALDPSAPNAAKWTFKTGGPVVSAPTLSSDGKTVFVGSTDQSVYAISTATGQKVWSAALDSAVNASPLLSSDGASVFVPSIAGTIYSLSASSGTVNWKYPTQGAITGSLTLSPDGSTIYAAEGNSIMYGIPVGGATTATPFYLSFPPTSTPSIDPNGNIYVATSEGNLTSFTPANSTPRWTFTVPNHMSVLSSPTFFQGQAIFGAANGIVYSISQSNGQQTWQYPQTGALGAIESSAVVTKGNSRIYLGSADGYVYALDTNGNLIAKRYTGTPVNGSAGVAADGSVWIASTSGTVYRFKDIPLPTIPSTVTPLPTSTPTATPLVTNTPTPTSTPTATATPSVVPLSISLKGTVKDGQHQTINITSAPNTLIRLRVDYPNGDHQSHKVTTNASGTATYDFVQGPSKTTHSHFTATVTAKAGTGSAQNTVTKTYTISFGSIDVSAEPRKLAVGKTIDIFVHAKKGTKVFVDFLFPNGKSKELSGKTGPKGLASIKYKVVKGLTSGSNHKVIVVVRFASGGSKSTKTTFTIA
jgi:outer membrane protein assembly factor BamB